MSFVHVARVSLLLFSLTLPLTAAAASIYVSPATLSLSAGQTGTLTVYVESTGEAMNAVSGVLSTDPGLSIQSVSRSGSMISFWATEPAVSGNTVSFEGVVTSPGYTGGAGKVLTVSVRAATEGVYAVRIGSGTVLANDGKATNITSGVRGASVSVTKAPPPPKKPAPEPEPEEEETPMVLPPPVISFVSELRDAYEAVTVAGTATSTATALYLSVAGEGTVRDIGPISLADGRFTVLIEEGFAPGTYTLSAYVTDEDGTRSSASLARELIVKAPSVVAGDLLALIQILGAVVAAIAVVGAFIWLLYYLSTHIMRQRHELMREIRQTDELTRKAFLLMRKDLAGYAAYLKKQERKRELSSAEVDFLDQLKSDLTESEQLIRKEIGDVERAARTPKRKR